MRQSGHETLADPTAFSAMTGELDHGTTHDTFGSLIYRQVTWQWCYQVKLVTRSLIHFEATNKHTLCKIKRTASGRPQLRKLAHGIQKRNRIIKNNRNK